MTVVGYGAVGRETVKLLAARGDKVAGCAAFAAGRPVCWRRNSCPRTCSIPIALRRACAGSDAVICCLGFPYDSRIWHKKWPKAMTNLLAACEKAKARFIFADNLYMYGPQTGPLVEDMPLTSFGRKPKLSAEITRLWQEAHSRGRVRRLRFEPPIFMARMSRRR